MTSSIGRAQRVRGALMGVAVGDALGWPQEQNAKNIDRRSAVPEARFRAWTRRSGGRFQPYEEPIGSGEFSDDTQLTLCVARSLLRGSWWFEHFTRNELPVWPLYERGGGRSVLRAAAAWAGGQPPWRSDKVDPRDYFSTGANGVAMRVLPHVVFGTGDDYDAIRQRIALDSCSTHGHAAALIGALIHASSLWYLVRHEGTLGYGELLDRLADEVSTWADRSALEFPSDWLDARAQMRGETFEEEWRHTVDGARSLIGIAQESIARGPLADDEQTLGRLGTFDRKVNGSGVVTAVGAALIASRSASSPELGLVQSAYLRGADTDTLASMTGALLGAVAGIEWMNGLRRTVQDSDYLINLADELLRGEAKAGSSADQVTKPKLDRWVRSLMSSSPGSASELPGGRMVLLEASEELASRSAKTRTSRFRVRTADGETLFIVKHSRSPAEPSTRANAVTHVGVRVRVSSLGEARKFYEDVLGLTPSRTGDSFARYGDAFALEAIPDRPTSLPFADADYRIHVEVADVEALHTAVLASGSRIAEPLRRDRGRSRFTCTDPDGHLIEVVAPTAQR